MREEAWFGVLLSFVTLASCDGLRRFPSTVLGSCWVGLPLGFFEGQEEDSDAIAALSSFDLDPAEDNVVASGPLPSLLTVAAPSNPSHRVF
ncbi:hypothetical protein HN51_041655 [Arachis hypogaea]